MEKAQKKVVVDFIKAFSCACSVTKNLSQQLGVEADPMLLRSVVGFSSGISTMGDTCGVANGGVAVLGREYAGLRSGVDLSGSGYGDAAGIVFHGLLKSDRIFEDERRFRPAKLFESCKHLYQTVERDFGSAHCAEIPGLRLDEPGGCERYQEEKKIDLCRKIAEAVTHLVREQLRTPSRTRGVRSASLWQGFSDGGGSYPESC